MNTEIAFYSKMLIQKKFKYFFVVKSLNILNIYLSFALPFSKGPSSGQLDFLCCCRCCCCSIGWLIDSLNVVG